MSASDVYTYLAIISTSGLVLSEILAWSTCEAKGLTQVYKFCGCYKRTTATQTSCYEDINPNVEMEFIESNMDTDSVASYQSMELSEEN